MDDIKTKTITHPLENALDITPGTTIVEYTETLPAVLVVHPSYDTKDDEIEVQLEEIRTEAMDAFEVQAQEVEQVEGKYKARIGEVAANFLNTALSAVKEKSLLKQHKDKLVVAQQKAIKPGTVNNNVIVTSHNELLKLIAGSKDSKKE